MKQEVDNKNKFPFHSDKTIPGISVLMTVFNAEEYLAASIESIRHQTFHDWEFIIVDDASTDRSLAIMQSYAQKDSRIKIIRNAVNKGQTRCLNQGLADARGIWIARQDADDLSHPKRFEKQWERLQEEPALVLLGTSGTMIDSKNRIIGLLDMPLTHEVITWSMAIKNPFIHTSVLFRAEVVRSLGGYNELYQIAQDYDLWTRMMHHYRVANLPERLISYRHLESSLSKSGSSRMFEEAAQIAEREEKYSFGRELQPKERFLVQAFREGGERKQQDSFFKCLSNLQPSSFSLSQKMTHDQRRLKAIFHLQGAGNKNQNRYGSFKEVIIAFLVAPCYTVQWLKSRFFSLPF